MKINPFLLTDAYKISHPVQYPEGTEFIYSNTTARGSRIEGVDKIVVFGIQYFIKEYLIKQFNTGFFERDKDEVLLELKTFFDEYFGPDTVDVTRYGDLHDLGYLPLIIKALPEGSRCNIRVPFMTIINTDPKFYWLTNFVETISQTVMWNFIVSATIAREFRQLMDLYASQTCDNNDFVGFQGHNFSMRGMSSFESALCTDAAHLLSFVGSDTLAGNMFVKEYYGADPSIEMISCSVPATEHAVMCAGGAKNEFETFRRLIEDIYPSGIVSIVSDTWDLWKVVTKILPVLYQEIMSRDGKVVIRPDSGDPVKIICGYFCRDTKLTKDELLDKMSSNSWLLKNTNDDNDCFYTIDCKYITDLGKEISYYESCGVIDLLCQGFGGKFNDKKYFELDPHIGVIYGDAITYDRAEQIFQQLARKRFASNNIVLGIGSFTYQYNTRDTFSIACKATWAQINGVSHNIFKDPATDDGTKKSACGLLRVNKIGDDYKCKEQVTQEEECGGELTPIFQDGCLLIDHNFHDIRKRLNEV